MKVNKLLNQKVLILVLFMLLTFSYVQWLIVCSHYGFVPFHHIFYYLMLPFTSIVSLFLYLFKVQEIDIYFAPIIYFALLSIFIFYLVKRVKWHAISYIINIFLASWVLLELVAYLQKGYYNDNHFNFGKIVIYSYGHWITDLSPEIYMIFP